MGLLDLNQVAPLQDYFAAPQAGTRLYVYNAGTTTISPIFRDEDLTDMQANPITADASGVFPTGYLFNGAYTVVLRSAQGRLLANVDTVYVRGPAREFPSPQTLKTDRVLSYNAPEPAQSVVPQDVLRVSEGGYTYQVAPESEQDPHLITSGGVKLNVCGRHQFTPEAFGAVGDGLVNDTEAWTILLRAAAQATATGPVHIYARGSYLLDALPTLSQFDETAGLPVQHDSVSFDLAGAQMIHSGVGDGILSLEGNAATRHRYEVTGGLWLAKSQTRWLIRGRDVRGSTFAPEALIGPSPCIGLLLQNWRTWSENNSFGGARTLEGRKLGHILGFQGRKQAWAYEATGLGLASDAVDYLGAFATAPAGSARAMYFDTSTEQVRRHTGSAWQDVFHIENVNTGVAGKSFARTKIRNVLAAAADDFTRDGLVIHVDGASLYDSEIDGVRGNVTNEGGSLIYWNDNYALNTVIRNIGCEKANVGANPMAYVFRTGPDFDTATEAPELIDINWSGGSAEPVDPNAGVVVTGQYREKFLNVSEGVPHRVLSAGQFHSNSTVEVVLKSNSNLVLGRALVGRKTSGTSLRIEDAFAQRTTAGPWSQANVTASTPITEGDGPRWIAPAAGSITAITLISDQARTAGTCTAAVRHNSGLAGAAGSSVGLSAVLNSTDSTRAITRQAPGLDRFAAGDEIYAVVTSNSAWAPAGTNVRVIIEVELCGDVVWQDDGGDLTVTTQVHETLRMMTRVWKA